ncbi:ATP-NAD kinase-like domain-containing protein [Tuber indicum]|nr:ATP-NAD kinase-like domain-containing protein [Tuber indicum]
MELPTDSTPTPAYISDSECGERLTFRQDEEKALSIPLEYLLALVPAETSNTYTLISQTGPGGGVISSTIAGPPAEIIERYCIPVDTPAHLQKPVSVVISPYSGLGRAELYFSTLLAPVLEYYSVDYGKHTVTSPAAIKTIANGLPEGTSTVIILSGDTLIFELLNQLPSTKRPTLVLIPTGTGNGLASSLYRPSPPDDLIRSAFHTFLHGISHPLPGFAVKFSPGARLLEEAIPEQGLKGTVVTSWGFHASLVADASTPEMRSSGTEKFQVAAKQNLTPSLHAYRGTISIVRPGSTEWEEVDDTNDEGHFYLVVTGVSNFEPTFTISPAANGMDGILRIIYFGVGDVEGAEGVMGVMKAVYDGGKHVSIPGVRYQEVDGVKIHLKEAEEKWRRICVDGAVVTLEEEGWLEVNRHEGWADVVYRSRFDS